MGPNQTAKLEPNQLAKGILSMPIMDGIKETRILKQLMPRVPVIIFTANGNAFVEREALAAGASALVSKSDPATLLVEKARELLDNIAA